VEPRIVLASASPRRRQILRSLGIPFKAVISNVDESPLRGETPEGLVRRLCQAKAAFVARFETLPVLAADTEVVCEGRVLGKPRSRDHAAEMLRLLQGRTHDVLTGVCLLVSGVERSAVDRTKVSLASMEEEEISWYASTHEPMDRAGGYHVDGRGALFIESVNGSPSGVAGLPARLVLLLAREAGLSLFPP
jgi:septum formation protein